MTEKRLRRSGKTNEMATQVAERCNLPVGTILDLLHAGWVYTERVGEPYRWESPTVQAEALDAQ
jgi:hypothetical protein